MVNHFFKEMNMDRFPLAVEYDEFGPQVDSQIAVEYFKNAIEVRLRRQRELRLAGVPEWHISEILDEECLNGAVLH